jgi:fluoroacetyl-CoA thioesterase
MAKNDPVLDEEGSAEMVVGVVDLASSLSANTTDDFPKVFATARMVALMEVAAARVLQPLLEDGELSVGVTVDITHSAPTPLGARVTATARYLGREGKLYLFEVLAADEGGEIGRGRHKRAIVNSERLKAGANKRMLGSAS